jgi:hypothetical protein
MRSTQSAVVAAPLLAGFSRASVIVMSDDAENFRWSGAAILGFTIAAVALIGTVQCAFNARQYIWSEADVRAWWPDMEENSAREELLRADQDRAFGRWQVWTAWTRRTYALGILALLTALALALPPPHNLGIQDSLRWAASGVAFAASAGEACWIVANFWQASRKGCAMKGMSRVGREMAISVSGNLPGRPGSRPRRWCSRPGFLSGSGCVVTAGRSRGIAVLARVAGTGARARRPSVHRRAGTRWSPAR